MSDEDVSGMIVEERKGIRGRLRGAFDRKLQQYKAEAIEKRKQDQFYKQQLAEARKREGYKYAKLSAQQRAREEAKRRFRGGGGFGGIIGNLGSVGGGAQKAGGRISTNMESVMFGGGQKSPVRLPSRRKTRPKKRGKRGSRRRNPSNDPFSGLWGV